MFTHKTSFTSITTRHKADAKQPNFPNNLWAHAIIDPRIAREDFSMGLKIAKMGSEEIETIDTRADFHARSRETLEKD